jgi:hypothetical protein
MGVASAIEHRDRPGADERRTRFTSSPSTPSLTPRSSGALPQIWISHREPLFTAPSRTRTARGPSASGSRIPSRPSETSSRARSGTSARTSTTRSTARTRWAFPARRSPRRASTRSNQREGAPDGRPPAAPPLANRRSTPILATSRRTRGLRARLQTRRGAPRGSLHRAARRMICSFRAGYTFTMRCWRAEGACGGGRFRL